MSELAVLALRAANARRTLEQLDRNGYGAAARAQVVKARLAWEQAERELSAAKGIVDAPSS